MRSTLTLLLLGLGSIAMAQTPEILAAEFERARKITLSYLEAMPVDNYSFRPQDGTRTFSEQMLHAAQGTFNLIANATGMERRYAGKNLEKDVSLQNAVEVKRLVNESYDFAIEAIRGMDAQKFGDKVKSGPFEVTRFGWAFKAFEHIAHHRGQAAIYLRLAGVEPPAYQLF